MGLGYACDDCGYLVAGSDETAVETEKRKHEQKEDHTMSQVV